MKVLVIDDALWHQAAAKLTLKGHKVIVLPSVEAAFDFFLHYKAGSLDAVLTDLWLPTPEFKFIGEGSNRRATCLHAQSNPDDGQFVAQFIPAGMIFAVTAINLGIKYVAICSDQHAHGDNRFNNLTPLLFRSQDKFQKPKIWFCETGWGVSRCWSVRQNRFVGVAPKDMRGFDPQEADLRVAKDWGSILSLLRAEGKKK